MNYVVDLRCAHCGKLIAPADPNGGYILGGVHVEVVTGSCPECGTEFNGPGIAKAFTVDQLMEMQDVIDTIQTRKFGFGEMYVTFLKGRVCEIGSRTGRRFNI